jgi:hypothetical protein
MTKRETLAKVTMIAAIAVLVTLTIPMAAMAQDTDFDGMPDAWENAHGCLMANTADHWMDPDGDNISSVYELIYSDLMDPCDPDTDGDSVTDNVDNCKLTSNPDQADAGWNTSAGASVVLDDDMDIYTWLVYPTENGNTVHDGNTAFTSYDNVSFTTALGNTDTYQWLRFWIYLTDPASDFLLQVNCSGAWDNHRWGFSSDGVWDGYQWPMMGADYNLPQGRWIPVMLNLQTHLGCGAADSIDGMAFGTRLATGTKAYFDSVTLYQDFPEGDVCDFTNDFDGDGMTDGYEYQNACLNMLVGDSTLDADADGLSNLAEENAATDPCNDDTDGDGLTDGDEVSVYLTDPLLTDTDGDGAGDRNDNCMLDGNSVQADMGWTFQAGASVVLDDDMDLYAWVVQPTETGATVHDGDTAFISNDNSHFSAPLGNTNTHDWLRFWIYLTAANSDLLLQVRCTDSWEHRWGFSSDGVWDGSASTMKGTDYGLPQGQWLPVMLHLEDHLGCAPGEGVNGLAFSINPASGTQIFFDSVALYADRPLGDVCDPDVDGDGLANVVETDTGVYVGDTNTGTDPYEFDTDGDGMDDGWEVTYNSGCGVAPLAGDTAADPDGDGLSNLVEYNLTTNPCSTDTDGDGMDDLWETTNTCMDPVERDDVYLVGSYDTTGFALGVYVSGNYAYVADYTSGLQIIDVSNPTNPTLVGTYVPIVARDVHVSGNYAYVTDDGIGFQIINVSNPTNPTLEGTLALSSLADSVYQSGNYAYVANSESGLKIIDVSSPTNPTLEATYDTEGAGGVYVSGNYAYVADDNSGLQIINVSNPTNPTLEGTYNTSGSASGVYLSGDYAYVADLSSGLQIIDVSSLTNPILEGSYDTPGLAIDVHVSGNYAYVADNYSGLQIIGLFDLTSPTLEGSYDTPERSVELYVSGDYVYVAEGYSGLLIIRIPDEGDTDTLFDTLEYGLGTDPCGNDSDGDGLDDHLEVRVSCSDPTLADTDGDGLSDDTEDANANGIVDTDETSPCNADTDNDNINDGDEVNTFSTNPLLLDTDGDGLDDYSEIYFWGTDPVEADTDSDGLSDYDEIMTYFTNPWLIDTDGDGVSDYSEALLTGTDPLDPDTDDDGTYDGDETDTTLTDGDTDAIPNNWEDLYPCMQGATADDTGDPDSDNLTNAQEYAAGTDPCAADTDSDGLTDDYEINTSSTDPTNPDTDGDGLNDGDEVNTHLTDPKNPDHDGDGYSDGEEISKGSDPLDPGSIPPQPDYLINYQGRVTDSLGVTVGDTTLSMTFGLFNVLSGGTELWFETQSVNVQQGIYNVLLGSQADLDPDDFISSMLYLEVEVEGEIMTPRARITSTGSAMHSHRAFGGRQEIDTRPVQILAGTKSVTVQVSFKYEFNSPPQVIVSFGGIIGMGEVNNITTAGFDLTFVPAPGGSSGTFTYQAFGN